MLLIHSVTSVLTCIGLYQSAISFFLLLLLLHISAFENLLSTSNGSHRLYAGICFAVKVKGLMVGEVLLKVIYCLLYLHMLYLFCGYEWINLLTLVVCSSYWFNLPVSQQTFCHVTAGKARMTAEFYVGAAVSGSWYCGCWFNVILSYWTLATWLLLVLRVTFVLNVTSKNVCCENSLLQNICTVFYDLFLSYFYVSRP